MKAALSLLALLVFGCGTKYTKWESLTLSVAPPLTAGTIERRLIIEDKQSAGNFFAIERLPYTINTRLSTEENCLRILAAKMKKSEISKIERTTVGKYEGVSIPLPECNGLNTNCVVTVFAKNSELYRLDLVTKRTAQNPKPKLDALRNCWNSIR